VLSVEGLWGAGRAQKRCNSDWGRREEKAMDTSQEVRIGRLGLAGGLYLQPHPVGLVVFAHGSGSSRLSPRNEFVASFLRERRIGTLLFDLLTDVEATDRGKVFDIELLAARLCDALDWILAKGGLGAIPIGLFGASTGAAAALVAAARRPTHIAAVVSRGGRPDLARESLALVGAPTLLIVGGDDQEVLRLNRDALHVMRCEKKLEVIAGATHLFEEPGALAHVADLAAGWFVDHFTCQEAP